VTVPNRPKPTRVVLFIDAQNLYNRCKDHFGWPWADPVLLGELLVEADRRRYGPDSHVLTGVRYYTGIHDPNRRPDDHGRMQRRLAAYEARGVHTVAIPLRYVQEGQRFRGREKGVDVRIAIDMLRLAQKGLFDVAIVISEDSDLNEAIRDVYELRDYERWVAVENALPYGPSGRRPKWLAAHRKRRIEAPMFRESEDRAIY
jgi:uncharacterized LabA/DUF88 family protein